MRDGNPASAQRDDLPAILQLSRQRDTPPLLCFLTWSAAHHQPKPPAWSRRPAPPTLLGGPP
ncbi:hypothetical protein [Streptomyces sp. NPDC048191]|uniref:hypothetical protein n=1 Tax=Streptomyces sp. NPDC048191 TaxID=3155484 RepID=UPI0033FDE228